MNDLPQERNETVLLVHGTGAAADKDDGDKWWQRPKDRENFWQRLNDDLGSSNIKVSNDIFHWSGANKESERTAAGQDLLRNWIERFERERRPYHLIGHSHGGSVIWHALQLANSEGQRLNHLKSWSTVGTPFFQYRFRIGSLALLKWPFIYVLMVLILSTVVFVWTLPLAWFSGGLRRYLHESISGGWFGVDSPIWSLLLFAPAVFVVMLLTLISEWTSDVIRRRRERGGTFATLGDRWLGLWSAHDEAINALKQTVHADELRQIRTDLQEQSKPEKRDGNRQKLNWKNIVWIPLALWGALELWRRFDRVDYIMLLSAVVAILVVGTTVILARKFVIWFVDYLVNHVASDVAVRAIQGNDGWSTEHVVAVSESPCSSSAYPSLPSFIDDELADASRPHLQELLPNVRGLLGQLSLAPLARSVVKSLTWKELMHNCYFDNPNVRKLLAMHIKSHSAEPTTEETATDELTQWLGEFKETVRKQMR